MKEKGRMRKETRSDSREVGLDCVDFNKVPQLGTVVAMNDITYLKELDEMKSQFVETVSHDLKNPLSAIMGFANLLEYDDSLSDNARLLLSKIISLSHTVRIVSDKTATIVLQWKDEKKGYKTQYTLLCCNK